MNVGTEMEGIGMSGSGERCIVGFAMAAWSVQQNLRRSSIVFV